MLRLKFFGKSVLNWDLFESAVVMQRTENQIEIASNLGNQKIIDKVELPVFHLIIKESTKGRGKRRAWGVLVL